MRTNFIALENIDEIIEDDSSVDSSVETTPEELGEVVAEQQEAAALESAVGEIVDNVEATSDDITTSIQASNDIETQAEILEEAAEEGDVNEAVAASVEHAVNAILRTAGLESLAPRYMPSIESFGGSSRQRQQSTQASLEGIKEVGEKIWEGIKKAIEWVKKQATAFWNWLKKLFDFTGRRIKKLQDQAATSTVKGDYEIDAPRFAKNAINLSPEDNWNNVILDSTVTIETYIKDVSVAAGKLSEELTKEAEKKAKKVKQKAEEEPEKTTEEIIAEVLTDLSPEKLGGVIKVEKNGDNYISKDVYWGGYKIVFKGISFITWTSLQGPTKDKDASSVKVSAVSGKDCVKLLKLIDVFYKNLGKEAATVSKVIQNSGSVVEKISKMALEASKLANSGDDKKEKKVAEALNKFAKEQSKLYSASSAIVLKTEKINMMAIKDFLDVIELSLSGKKKEDKKEDKK